MIQRCLFRRKILLLTAVFLLVLSGWVNIVPDSEFKTAFASSQSKAVYPNQTITYGGSPYAGNAALLYNFSGRPVVITGIRYTATYIPTSGNIVPGFLAITDTYGVWNGSTYVTGGIHLPLPNSGTQSYYYPFSIDQTVGMKNIVAANESNWVYETKAKYQITINEIDYIEYQLDNVTVQVSPQRHAQAVFQSSTPIPYSTFKMYNKTTRNTFTGTINKGSSSTQVIIDENDPNVVPEKYYTYDLYWDIGPSADIYVGSFTVEIPSDATLAKQAAEAAQQAAEQVNSIVNPALTVSGGVIQDNQGTVLQAARQARDAAQQANNKLDSINNAVTNISQSIPPVMNGIHGLNGATATSSGALQVVIDSSGATQYSYRIDNGGWSPWMPIADTVSIPVPKGVHTLTVQVANGPVGTPGPAAKSSMQVIGL